MNRGERKSFALIGYLRKHRATGPSTEMHKKKITLGSVQSCDESKFNLVDGTFWKRQNYSALLSEVGILLRKMIMS